MISDPEQLKPSTCWSETVWSTSREEDLIDTSSSPRLCIAALLPFKKEGFGLAKFERMLRWMTRCSEVFGVEITFVLNADTGYVFNLSEALYAEVITRFRALYPDASFVSGVTAVEAHPMTFGASCYHPHLEMPKPTLPAK